MKIDPKFPDLVQPAELRDARLFREALWAALTDQESAPRVSPEIVCVRQDWGELHLGRSLTNGPLCLAGEEYRTGLGTHAESEIPTIVSMVLVFFRNRFL